jgi:rhamnulokinase
VPFEGIGDDADILVRPVGTLLPSVAGETGPREIPVVAPACHDTGSAVAAVPAEDGDFAYISSGTWSPLGLEVREPVINDAGLEANLTNEGGVDGASRLLRNVAGLWLLRMPSLLGYRRQRASYEELASLRAGAAVCLAIRPDDRCFSSPPDMPGAITDFCRRKGQPAPADRAAIVRCVLESLAFKYRWVLERIEEVRGKRARVVHIVGGGSQNEALNQFTANAIGRPVIAGPAEATATGNVSFRRWNGTRGFGEDGRALVRRSFSPRSMSRSSPAGTTFSIAPALLTNPAGASPLSYPINKP